MSSGKVLEREKQADLMSRKRALERDLSIPPVQNKRRRSYAKRSLRYFAKTYFPHLYYLKMAAFQVNRQKKMEALIKFGNRTADADPRGTGKTTDAVVAAMWALLNGWRVHFIIVRANDIEAKVIISDIKRELETNDLLLEDYPEVCIPVRALEGAAQRAGRQTVDGVRTRIEYHGSSIYFPQVEGSPSSGSVISVAGIEGKIRGRNLNGRRPDFVLLDDIEDQESANSIIISAKRERIILSDIGGLAGPGKSVATFWRGTILKRGCLIDRYTDRALKPAWQGTRQKSLVTEPENDKLWARYTELMDQGKRDGSDPTGRVATKFYRKHRKAMDKGSVLAWSENYIREKAPDGSMQEISSLQHLMNLRIELGEEAFQTEYQNDPPEDDKYSGLTADLVANRLSMCPQFVVPVGLEAHLVQCIDIRGREIHYAVLACDENATGSFIDYGQIKVDAPDGDLRDPKSAVRPALEIAMLGALEKRRSMTEAEVTPYRDENGDPLSVSLTLVDAGWLEKVVYQFCNSSGPRWRATKGDQNQPGKRKFLSPKRGSGKKIGNNWYAVRQQQSRTWLFHMNADHWKLTCHERFSQTLGTSGAVTVFGNSPLEHKRFSKHIVAEEWDIEKGRFIKTYRWNHFLDCASGCFAAASMVGAELIKAPVVKKKQISAAVKQPAQGRQQSFNSHRRH